jgi:hypothetical protein
MATAIADAIRFDLMDSSLLMEGLTGVVGV